MRISRTNDTSRYVNAAMGRIPCDLSIVNCRLVNVFTGEIYPAEVDILDEMIVRVRKPGESQTLAKKIIDGENAFLIPGFIDTHIHVESTMMIPENFARAVLPLGTTTIVSDPHEIANVAGIDGVRFMLENAKRAPLRHFVLAPSCVPSLPGFESGGAQFSQKDIKDLLELPGVLGLGELMDYVGVCNNDPRMMSELYSARQSNLFIQGHAPMLQGDLLSAYITAGVMSDHECRSAQECAEKVRLGMHVNLKTSSLSDHLAAALQGIAGFQWKDSVSLCTDDVHAETIYEEGHLNRVVRKAVEHGSNPVDVIRFASFNAAREYGFLDIGAVAPGYMADLQLVDALDGRTPNYVFLGGKLVGVQGRYVGKMATPGSTGPFPNTFSLTQMDNPDDFSLKVKDMDRPFKTLVIQYKYINQTFNQGIYESLSSEDGKLKIDEDLDLALFAVINRYGKRDKVIVPMRGSGIKTGAFATTVSHDCHNLVIAYRNTKDAYLACREIERIGGGFAVVANGKLLASLPLPVGGIMSDLPIEKLTPLIRSVVEALHTIGDESCTLLRFATSSLPVLPGTSVTDVGVFDGKTKRRISLFHVD